MFLYPILGQRSVDVAQRVWCSRDKGGAWENLMTKDVPVPGPGPANCDTSAITRNIEYGRKNRVSGTPTIFFPDGTRVPGAVGAAQVEKFLAQTK
jgi:thiol:disulfide interchange protein DsbC